MAKTLGDVWTLESPSEALASEDLNFIASMALDKHFVRARNYLKTLWPEDSWERIKEKLNVEGSAWYVWWMDGVYQHATNIANGTAAIALRGKSTGTRTRKGRSVKRSPGRAVVGLRS